MLFAGQHRELKPAGYAELPIDVAEMALDGFLADGKFAGDLAVAAAFFDRGYDFDFTRSQPEAAGRGLSGARPRCNRLTSNPELAFAYGANAV